MKRWNFSGHRATHGTQKHRGPGAIGCRMDPQGLQEQEDGWPLGDETVTVQPVHREHRCRTEPGVVKRSVPGAKGGLVSIEQA